ncbi:DUF1707 domain-containing protein [Micromonospora sp. NPDC050187]|uniref:DUF1707 domain-containing protein n=1 Tax=Micromonospora sp. NPDC050187 TaxID=3364277 RepID=UPI0037B8C509
MTNADGPGTHPPPALRIGAPERQMARDALEVHLDEERLDADEFARRVAVCEQAVDQTELLKIFADLPAPCPQLPSADAPAEADEDMQPGLLAGCLTLGLGIPVAIVVGVVYGTWWALAVPVTVTVTMAYVEHLRQPPRGRGESGGPHRPSD